MLKMKVNTLEEVETAFHGLYKAEGDSFILDVEGVTPADNNVDEVSGLREALNKERKLNKNAQSKLKKFGDVDPEEFYSLKDENDLLKADGNVDKLLEARMKPFERQQAQIASERDAALLELKSMKTDMAETSLKNAVVELANGKIKSEFLKDAQLRARYSLEYNEDVKDFVDKDGLTSVDWFAKQLLETPSWEIESVGSGANGGLKSKKVSSSNPWITDNLTEQCIVQNKSSALADKLKSQLG